MHLPNATRRPRRPTDGVVALVIGLVLSLVGIIGSTATAGASSGSYVALGDSYTAGPLIPNQTLDPLGCLRSDHDYPHLLAPTLGLPLRDASCSGATTADMASPQGVTPGPNPPQFDRLDPSTSVVTLGIGGNDLGFTDIVLSCIAITPLGPTCKGKFVHNGTDDISQRIAATAPKVAAVLDGIHQRSPGARVFVIGYPAILPATGFGCWPTMPIAWSDVPYLRSKELELDAMLSTQTGAHGATYVDLYTPSIGHDACRAPGVKWVEPVVPTSPAAPVHPNGLGMSHFATIIAAAAR